MSISDKTRLKAIQHQVKELRLLDKWLSVKVYFNETHTEFYYMFYVENSKHIIDQVKASNDTYLDTAKMLMDKYNVSLLSSYNNLSEDELNNLLIAKDNTIYSQVYKDIFILFFELSNRHLNKDYITSDDEFKSGVMGIDYLKYRYIPSLSGIPLLVGRDI
jgi:hypothetical protein